MARCALGWSSLALLNGNQRKPSGTQGYGLAALKLYGSGGNNDESRCDAYGLLKCLALGPADQGRSGDVIGMRLCLKKRGGGSFD